MEVIDPGHVYSLRCLDMGIKDMQVIITFVKREGENYPGNVGFYPGTTTQEVLRVLIDRTKYVNNQIYDGHNIQVLYHLRAAIYELELRAAERHGRTLPILGHTNIENKMVCVKCGHIGCNGECH